MQNSIYRYFASQLLKTLRNLFPQRHAIQVSFGQQAVHLLSYIKPAVIAVFLLDPKGDTLNLFFTGQGHLIVASKLGCSLHGKIDHSY